MSTRFYDTDLTDAAWAWVAPVLPAARPGGRPRTANLRAVLNAIFYLLRTGCQWRLLPRLRKPEEPEDRPHLGDPPLAIVTRAWRQYVFGDGERIDRKAFVFCFLDRLRSALRRRDLFIAPSFRYADARIGLLSGPAWGIRSTGCLQILGPFSVG
jgi:transposase